MGLQRQAYRCRAHLDRLPLRRYRHRAIYAWWSNNWLRSRVTSHVRTLRPDIVHLHWIGDGLLRPDDIGGFGCPVVWTLHDMWAFTGGCHYAAECRRFTAGCGSCPQLGSTRDDDLSSRNATTKRVAYLDHPFTAVAPSHWMAQAAQESQALRGRRIEVIPNCVPLEIFRPRNQAEARNRLNLPRDAFVIAGGSAADLSDKRKGLLLLISAVERLRTHLPNRQVINVLFGPTPATPQLFSDGGTHSVGFIADETELSWVYAAADVVAIPSRQDNLPNVALEAVACGIPLAGFASGGLIEVVKSPVAGRLASHLTAEALADSLATIASERGSTPEAASARRQFAEENFAPVVVANQYRALYADLLSAGVPARSPAGRC